MPEPQTGAPLEDFPDLTALFPPPALDAWRAEVEQLLKGAPYERRMLTPTPEGITLQPLYTPADTADLDIAGVVPGEAPFTRGTRLLGYRLDPWEVAQEIPYPDPHAFNEALRHDLARGQTAAVLALDAAGRAGLDPDEAAGESVGRGGTTIASLDDLAAAFAGIDLGSVPVFLHAGAAALPAASLLLAMARRNGIDPGRMRGSIGTDPLADAVSGTGEATEAELEAAYDRLAALTAWVEARAGESGPRLRTLVAWGPRWHDGGGSAVEELAYTFASAIETLRALERRGLDPETAARRFFFGFSAGPQFLVEIAKFRAARLLWGRIGEACGWEDRGGDIWIHARTAARNQSPLDPHTNILRGTTEALSAILGGCDSLTVLPFDSPLGLPSEPSRRLARNTQLILRDESRFDAVLDAVGGSWAIDRITVDLAGKAWELFREVEEDGGLRASLFRGAPQARIAAAARQRRQDVATRRDVLVGVNQYVDPHERPFRALEFDLEAWRTGIIAQARQRRDPARAGAALASLHAAADRAAAGRAAANRAIAGRAEDGAAASPAAFCEAAIEAALAGATLGELSRRAGISLAPARDPAGAPGNGRESSAAPESVPERIAPVPMLRLAGEFAALRARVRALQPRDEAAATTAPQIRLICFGPPAALRARLEFTRGFFRTGGFTGLTEEWFDAGEEGRRAAVQNAAAPVQVILSTDDLYPDLVPPAAAALRQAAPEAAIVLAGLPADAGTVARYRAAGIDEFIHLKADLGAVLGALAGRMGGRS